MQSLLSSNASKQPVGRPRSRDAQAGYVARARRNKPVKIQFPHPLCWWRTRPAHSFKAADVLIARRFLRKSAIIGEPHWFLGAEGNAAVALGVAMRVRRHKFNLVSLDLAMTAVLCVAIEGDAAAAVMLSATLKNQIGNDLALGLLSDTWLTRNSRKLQRQVQPEPMQDSPALQNE